MILGSEEHKELFCRTFIDTHIPFRPEELPWPELSQETIQKLASFPIWDYAVHTERQVFHKLNAYAEIETDPLLREALALQAYEEGRHADLLECFLKRYNIPLTKKPDDTLPRDMEYGFMRTGAGESIDSFFAFGFIQISKNTDDYPLQLIELMEPIVQEEARHILFIKNWLLYQRHRRPFWRQSIHFFMTLWAFADAGWDRLSNLKKLGGNAFTMQALEYEKTSSFTPRDFVTLCLNENKRRLAPYDERLSRPNLIPGLMRLARLFL